MSSEPVTGIPKHQLVPRGLTARDERGTSANASNPGHASRPIHEAAREVRHLHELERAGESEWTPWIALAGLILFLAAAGLLMYGIVEVASHLLAEG